MTRVSWDEGYSYLLGTINYTMPFLTKYPCKLITIRRDQKEWLSQETTFNFSGFVRDQLDLYIELKQKQKKQLQKEMQTYTTSY